MPRRDIDTAPDGYADLLATAKDKVRRAHVSAARRINSELVLMYVQLGRLILDRQTDEGWGSRVVHHLAGDLSAAFPGQRVISERNLRYCRTAARMFPDPIGLQVAAQLPWGHVMLLTDKITGAELQYWYARQAVAHGWSRSVLEHHITTDLHTRVESTPLQIPVAAVDSDAARDLVEDPYRLDFLGLDRGHWERQLEDATRTAGHPWPTSAFDLDLGRFSDIVNLRGSIKGLDPRVFIAVNASPGVMASVLKFAFPGFVEYRQGVFLDYAFDEDGVDTWFEQLGETARVEEIVNHVHLWDVLATTTNHQDEAALLLTPLVTLWSAALGANFPGRRFNVLANAAGDYGPELTFHSQA